VQGTGGNDVFVNVGGGVTIAGNGGSDTFQFKPGFGGATITDFNVSNDIITIDHALFATANDVLTHAHSANSGNDTIITDAANDQITLKGVHVGSLNQQDFHII
jgi:Ca2+-binding RTX toxin-like protein